MKIRAICLLMVYKDNYHSFWEVLKCRTHPRPEESESLGMGRSRHMAGKTAEWEKSRLVEKVSRGHSARPERNPSGIQRRRWGCQRELSGEDAQLELEDCLGVRYTMGPLEGSTFWGGCSSTIWKADSCKAEATVTCCGDFSHAAVFTAMWLLLPGRAHLRPPDPSHLSYHPCTRDESGFPHLPTYKGYLRSGWVNCEWPWG